jgi:hypothetical protein
MRNSKLWKTVAVFAMMSGAFASRATAQYTFKQGASDQPVGEDYHIEAAIGLWSPGPDIVISSESLGIPGSDIDFVNDLGIARHSTGDLKITLKASRKNKFHIEYTPNTWTASTTLARDIVFNGQRYHVSLPVNTDLSWKTWSFGYEYDFVSNARGFGGLLLNLKATDVSVTLTSAPLLSEFARARAPIPAIGGIARVYVVPQAAINFQLTALKVPTIQDQYEATYIDWELTGLFNATRNIGVTGGWRSRHVNYMLKKDTGDLTLSGLYLAAVVRY